MNSSSANRTAIDAAAARWVTRNDAGLNPAERAEFERWCASDARHEAAFAHYCAAWSVLDRPGQADVIMRELRAGVRRKRRNRAVLASVALVGVIAFWQMRAPIVEPLLTTELRSGGVLLAPEKRVLPDGSVVELKSGAEIAVEFTATLRRVTLLRGEAHFQVEKNPERPFAVEAGGVQVRAVGTAFSVQRDEMQIEVVVTEGSIAVERAGARAVSAAGAGRVGGSDSIEISEPRRLATAGAGQRVIVRADSIAAAPPAVVPVSAAELVERLAWRAPRVEFSATPLAEAVGMMNRSRAVDETALRLVIDSASSGLAKEPISGVFRADNTETFVRMLELSLGVQAERRGNDIVLRKAP
jgi:transmembrane sensor